MDCVSIREDITTQHVLYWQTSPQCRQRRGKPAASARAGLRKANAERWEIIFSSEFASCFQYENVEMTQT